MSPRWPGTATKVKNLGSDTSIILYSRDEMVRISLAHAAYFEADANYCNVFYFNGTRTMLPASLLSIERLLATITNSHTGNYIRIGKRFIINKRFVSRITILRQELELCDFESERTFRLPVSREALKNLKKILTS